MIWFEFKQFVTFLNWKKKYGYEKLEFFLKMNEVLFLVLWMMTAFLIPFFKNKNAGWIFVQNFWDLLITRATRWDYKSLCHTSLSQWIGAHKSTEFLKNQLCFSSFKFIINTTLNKTYSNFEQIWNSPF